MISRRASQDVFSLEIASLEYCRDYVGLRESSGPVKSVEADICSRELANQDAYQLVHCENSVD